MYPLNEERARDHMAEGCGGPLPIRSPVWQSWRFSPCNINIIASAAGPK